VSLKPIKKSDARKMDKMKAKKRDLRLNELPPRILIVTEGTKTEPFYFEILADKINKKEEFSKITRNPRVVVEVEGTGRNTSGLYQYLEDNYDSVELANYSKIWLVYDKDDFPKDRFDNVYHKASSSKKSKFNAAWSNQSFELWLLWHYKDYSTVAHRTEYIKNLKKYIPNYSKGDRTVYEKIVHDGDIRRAIQRAKQQEENYEHNGITTPSKMECASMVYKLVEELLQYIE